MKKLFTRFIVLFIVVFAMLATGCPKQDEITKASKYGYEMAERTRTAQHVSLELYNAKKFSLGLKDRFFDAAGATFDVLEIYNNEVERQNNLIKAGQQTLLGAKEVLKILFSEKVLSVANKFVDAFNLLPVDKASELFALLKTFASYALKIIDVLGVKSATLTPLKVT